MKKEARGGAAVDYLTDYLKTKAENEFKVKMAELELRKEELELEKRKVALQEATAYNVNVCDVGPDENECVLTYQEL